MKLSDSVKGFIIAIIVISLFLYGYRYYRYTQDEPEFCGSCHMIKESYADWLNGKHRDTVCQQCHQLGNVEQNLRLLSYVMTGKNPIATSHGRIKPWEECKNCHMDTISQGSVTPSKSYGHAKHAVVKGIECKACHVSKTHNFPPNTSSCQQCHSNKGVHGISMEEFSCIKCHSFSRKPLPMLSTEKCFKCHSDIPRKGPMSGLSCHYCHKPHSTEKPDSGSCTAECHKTEATMGQHGVHAQQGIECMYCHKPHKWVLGGSVPSSLCKECHSPKDPKRFRYIF